MSKQNTRRSLEGDNYSLEDYNDMINEIKQLEQTRGYLLPPDKQRIKAIQKIIQIEMQKQSREKNIVQEKVTAKEKIKSVPLYKKIEEQFQNQMNSELEKKKQRLAEIRQLHKPMNNDDLKEFQKAVEEKTQDLKQKKQMNSSFTDGVTNNFFKSNAYSEQMKQIYIEQNLRENKRQANFDLFKKRNQYWNKCKEDVKVNVSQKNIELLEKQDKRFFHRNELSPRGFAFLKRKNAPQDEEEPQDTNSNQIVLNRSSYQIGQDYMKSLKVSNAAKEQFKKSLEIEPPAKVERKNYLTEFLQKSKSRSEEERMEIKIQKCMGDNLLTAKEKKDRVAMIVQDYEEKMARDAFKKRITDGKENKVIDMTPQLNSFKSRLRLLQDADN